MRALIWVVLLATGLWSGYWWIGATKLESGVQAWIAGQSDLRVASVEVHGIPNRFDLTVTSPTYTDPASGVSVSSPFLQVYAMTWKPWHVIAALPAGQVITLPDQKVTVGYDNPQPSDFMRLSLQMHPSTDLGFQELITEAHRLTLNSDLGWGIGIEKAVVSAKETEQANNYRLGLRIEKITPDAGLMQVLAGIDLPPQIDEIYLDAQTTLSAALDRHAGETHPRLTNLILTDAHANWGELKFSANGALKAGPDGLALGEINLRIAGWKRLPPLLAALGLVKPDVAPTVERMLGIVAAQGGDPEVLQMVLSCKDGRMSLGPLPLGPAPKLN